MKNNKNEIIKAQRDANGLLNILHL